MYHALVLGSGIFWTITYVLIIRRGFADRTYGMPIVALCANISWEFIFVFVYPHEPILRAVDAAWLLLDAAIAYTALRFGPREFPGLPRWLFYGMFALTLAVAYGSVLLVSRELDGGRSEYAAFGQSVLMSGLFLAMLLSRGSLAGQSLGIGVCKLVGTACASAAVYFYDPSRAGSALLPFLFVAAFVLDALYVAGLYAMRRAVRPGSAAVPLGAAATRSL